MDPQTQLVSPGDLTAFRQDFATILRVEGAWCDTTAPALVESLKQQIADATAGPIMVDLCGVERLDSIGLTVLVAVAKECQAKDWAVTVCYDAEHIGRVFKAVRFDRLFAIAEVQPA